MAAGPTVSPAQVRSAEAFPTLDDAQMSVDAESDLLLQLNDALERLTAFEPRLGRVVECRFFGGLTEKETEDALGLTVRTVQRDWVKARVLLQNGRANGALRKLGAAQEGVLRRSIRRGGEYFDQVLWSMLKEDWGDHWVSTSPRVH